MSINLQYDYAQVLESGECVGVITSSYEVNHPLYVLIPDNNNDYIGHWYNRADGLWYTSSDFSILAEGLN